MDVSVVGFVGVIGFVVIVGVVGILLIIDYETKVQVFVCSKCKHF